MVVFILLYPVAPVVYFNSGCSSGYLRMLLVQELVLDYESHVGGTFEFICQKTDNQRNQVLRAPSSVGRKRNSMRVDHGGKG